MWSVIRGRTGGLNFPVRGISKHKGNVQTFGLAGRPPPIPSFSRTSYLLIRKTLRRVLGLLTVIILKTVSESNFFQSNIFATRKVKDEKKVANSLMAFNLSIHYPSISK